MEKENPSYVDKTTIDDESKVIDKVINEDEVHEVEFDDLPEEYRDAAHELYDVNPKVFRGLNNTQRIEVIKAVGLTTFKAMSHSGPLPDPESLGQYNEIITNGADRIMAMAENQQAHRIDIEKKVIKANNNQTTRGQWFGFLLALLFLGAALYLTLNGHEKVAGIIFGTTIIGLVSIFVIGKKSQKHR